MILILNIVELDFELIEATNIIKLSYDLAQWHELISCLSRSNYDQVNTGGGSSSGGSGTFAFAIKILIQSATDGVQAIDFPYPPPNFNRTKVESELTGSNRKQYFIIILLIKKN